MLDTANSVLALIGGIGGVIGIITAILVAWDKMEVIFANRLANKIEKSKLTPQCQLFITISTAEELKEVLDTLVSKKTIISLKPQASESASHSSPNQESNNGPQSS